MVEDRRRERDDEEKKGRKKNIAVVVGPCQSLAAAVFAKALVLHVYPVHEAKFLLQRGTISRSFFTVAGTRTIAPIVRFASFLFPLSRTYIGKTYSTVFPCIERKPSRH